MWVFFLVTLYIVKVFTARVPQNWASSACFSGLYKLNTTLPHFKLQTSGSSLNQMNKHTNLASSNPRTMSLSRAILYHYYYYYFFFFESARAYKSNQKLPLESAIHSPCACTASQKIKNKGLGGRRRSRRRRRIRRRGRKRFFIGPRMKINEFWQGAHRRGEERPTRPGLDGIEGALGFFLADSGSLQG